MWTICIFIELKYLQSEICVFNYKNVNLILANLLKYVVKKIVLPF